MFSHNRLSDYRQSLFYSVLMLILLSNLTIFFSVKLAKLGFYWAFYLSLAGIICDFNRLKKHYWWVVVPIALLGISDLTWFAWNYIGSLDFDRFNGYLNTGKRLILASVIGYYLLSVRFRYDPFSQNIIKFVIIITFIIASGMGIYQCLFISGRVDFFLGRATGAAYAYSIFSVALIFMLLSGKMNSKIMCYSLLIFVVSYFIIFQTGTRNVMATYPLLIIFIGIVRLRHLGIRPLIFVLLCMAVLTTLSYQRAIKPKLASTINEYHRYIDTNGSSYGSLSNRLAMWKIGLKLVGEHPLGSSLEERRSFAQHYVEKSHHDSSALFYIDVHLHNEVIDVASLMGIQGVAVLLFFYFSLMGYAYYTRNTALFAVMTGIVLCGLTDVLLVSREQTIMLCLLIIALVMWHNDRYQTYRVCA